MIGYAIHVMCLATGEVEEAIPSAAKEYMRQGGLKGENARAEKLSAVIATKAVKAR